MLARTRELLQPLHRARPATTGGHLTVAPPHTHPYAAGVSTGARTVGLSEGFRPNVALVAPAALVQCNRLREQRGRLDSLAEPVRSPALTAGVSARATRDRLGQ